MISVLLLLWGTLGFGTHADNASQGQGQEIIRSVEFAQLNWLGEGDPTSVPLSRVGVVEFFFGSSATQLLEENGGGFVNVVTDTVGGAGCQWSVQNLYLSYPDVEHMLRSSPTIQFNLTIPNVSRAMTLQFGVDISSQPLESDLPAGLHFLIARAATGAVAFNEIIASPQAMRVSSVRASVSPAPA